jgi:hypothetical protein
MNGFVRKAALSVVIASGLVGDAFAGRNAPPVLTSFSVHQIAPGYYVLDGQVGDEYPDECVVWFGGVLAGQFVTCDWDGTFSYFVEVDEYGKGEVSAQAYDNLDQGSNVDTDWIL